MGWALIIRVKVVVYDGGVIMRNIGNLILWTFSSLLNFVNELVKMKDELFYRRKLVHNYMGLQKN